MKGVFIRNSFIAREQYRTVHCDINNRKNTSKVA